jgi:hypothetical protein
MSQGRQGRATPESLVDKLAPKVAQARESLQSIPPEEIAWRSGAILQGDCLHLQMLFKPYEVDTTSFVVRWAGGQEAPSFFQSLVLTYLQTANGAASADRWISFRELPDGTFYHQAFQGYAPNRLSRRWGLEVEGFAAACRALGGMRLELGDAGFALRVLPRIDMAAIYWLGDEDFPSRASILFDANAHHYMVTDGLAILGNQLVSKILAAG